MRTLVVSLLAIGALAAPQSASAAIVTYTNQAAFLAALSSSGTDNFNSMPLTFTGSPITRGAGSFGYTATAANGFFPAGTFSDVWLSLNTATDPIVISGFTGGVYSLGGLFFGSDINGGYQSGNVTVSVLSGSTSASQTIVAATTSSFLGFISDSPLTSARVATVQPSSGYLWPTINNLTLGSTAVAAVPEPATWAMMIVGLGLVAGGLRRQGRTARARFVPAL